MNFEVKPFTEADLDRLCHDIGDVLAGERFFRSRWDMGMFWKNFVVAQHSYLVRVPVWTPHERDTRFIFCMEGRCCEIKRRSAHGELARVIPFGVHPAKRTPQFDSAAAEAVDTFYRDLRGLESFVSTKIEWSQE